METAVLRVLTGSSLWTPGAVRRARQWWVRWGDPWAALSPRQRAVAWAAAHGLSNKEITCLLGLSLETMRTHLSRALARLGRADRSDLARWLVLGGLLDPQRAALLDLNPLPDLLRLLEAIMNFPGKGNHPPQDPVPPRGGLMEGEKQLGGVVGNPRRREAGDGRTVVAL